MFTVERSRWEKGWVLYLLKREVDGRESGCGVYCRITQMEGKVDVVFKVETSI